MNYHPWTDDRNDSYAWISDSPEEVEAKDYILTKGTSARDWFPSGAIFDFAPNKGIKPADSIPNFLGFHIVSEKLKQLLEATAGARFEFLPVRLRNHKKKILPDAYYVANLLDLVTCVDRSRSDFTVDELDKKEIRRFRRLVLDTSKIGPDSKIFRLGERPRLLIVREDLARAITEAGCTGMRFMPMEDFGAEFRPLDNYDL
ncbi:imm11 family protein [Archangium sp.]|uniref:imm11 family protein n=1 Tax=Archangium sp. TaxID=1872627 RepID=UPI00389A9848